MSQESALRSALISFYAATYGQSRARILDSIYRHFSRADTEFDAEAFATWRQNRTTPKEEGARATDTRAYYAARYGASEGRIEARVLLHFARADTDFDAAAFSAFFEKLMRVEEFTSAQVAYARQTLGSLLAAPSLSVAISLPSSVPVERTANLKRERQDTALVVDAFEAKVAQYRCPFYGDASREALRGVHPKSYGLIEARLEIVGEGQSPGLATLPILPNALRVGLFAKIDQQFDCKVRLSGSGGLPFHVLSDATSRQSHGLALKLLDAEGRTHHDLLFNNGPVFPSADPKSAIPQAEEDVAASVLTLVDEALARGSEDEQPLAMQQFSISAYAWGASQAVKYMLRPLNDVAVALPEKKRAAYAQILDRKADDFRSAAVRYLLEETAAPIDFGLYVQFADADDSGSGGCPIDDETVAWTTPFYQVATLRMNPQTPLTPGSADEEDLVFNSYHVSERAHLPLGRLNRARLWAYRASAAARHTHHAIARAPHPYRVPTSMQVAVVGGGASGLTAALALSEFGYRVTVFEKSKALGGHATTKDVLGKQHRRDPAFGAFRRRQWPNFMALLKTLEVSPISLGKTNDWFDSPFVGWFREDGEPVVRTPEIMAEGQRFAAALNKALRDPEADGRTVGSLVDELGLSPEFLSCWFMGGVILYFGGHSIQYYLDYPLRLIAWMWQNSVSEPSAEPIELLRVEDATYIARFAAYLREKGVRIETGANVSMVERSPAETTLRVSTGEEAAHEQAFGHVVLAIQPHRALQVMEACARPDEKAILEAFEYTVDTVAVHADPSYLPEREEDWRLANIRLPAADQPPARRGDTLPYTLVTPCSKDGKTPIFATYDYAHASDWGEEVDTFTFSHMKVNPKTQRLRRALAEIQGNEGLHYAGSWQRGLTLHEDAVVSGLEAANRILGAHGAYPVLQPPVPLPAPFEAVTQNTSVAAGDFGETPAQTAAKLKEILKEIGELDVNSLDGETDLQALGLSSLHFARLANAINETFPPESDAEVDITLLLQMETLNEVVEYIRELLDDAIPSRSALVDDMAEVLTDPPTALHKSVPLGQPLGPDRRSFVAGLEDYEARERVLPRLWVWLVQGMGLFGLFTTVAVSANLAFASAMGMYAQLGGLGAALALPVAWTVYTVTYAAAAVAVKWLVVGRLKPGRYRVYRSTHLRWWIANLFLNFGQQSLWLPFRDSHLGNWLFQALGGDVHQSARFTIDGLNPALSLIDADLLSVREGVYLRRGALVQCHLFMDGSLILAPITLEERSVVWTRGVVEPGSHIEKDGLLEHHSVVSMGGRLPASMRARGVPAEVVERHSEDGVRTPRFGSAKSIHTLMGFLVFPYIAAAALACFWQLIAWMVEAPTLRHFDWRVWLTLWPALIVTVVIFGILAALFKKMVLGRLRAGMLENERPYRFAAASFVAFLLSRAALFCPRDLRWFFLRCMGGNVAYGSVTDCPLMDLTYADLLTMEAGSFYSPAAYMDFVSLRDGEVVQEAVHLESMAYVGAYSTIAAPLHLPSMALLASTSALASDADVESAQVWVGSPARRVPISLGEVTESSHAMGGFALLKARVIDLLNHYAIFLVLSGIALLGYHLFADALWPASGSVDWGVRLGASVGLVTYGYVATTFLMLPLLRIDTELLRWLCVKDEAIRTEGFERESWKFNVWHLLSNHLLPYGFLTDIYAGTPFQNWLARRLGARIGRDVYLANGVGIREFTFTFLEDGVMLNRGSALIAHSELPNGRIVMKDIELRAHSSMAFISYIVGGTELPQGAILGSLSRPFDSQDLDSDGEYNNTPCQRREPTV